MKKLLWIMTLSLCAACPPAPQTGVTSATATDPENSTTSSTGEEGSTSTGEDNSSTSTSTDPTDGTTGETPATCDALFGEDFEALQDLAEAATEWNPTLTAEQACKEERVICEVIERQCRVVELDVSKIGLGQIPPSMNQLTELRKLYLFSNDLSSLPDDFGNPWTNLLMLYLSHNSLSNLPVGFGNAWTHLELLELGDNNLSDVPVEFGSTWSELIQLDLYGNNLSSVSTEFGSTWPKLGWLTLSGNNLSSIPAGFGSTWPELGWLWLDSNNLSSLPDGFGNLWPKLEWLYLSYNKLSSLPEGFGSTWTHLKWLNLSSNVLLSSLPEGFGSTWNNLQWLDLSSNYLSSVPAGFGSMWANMSMYLSGNQFTGELTDQLPQSLLDQALKKGGINLTLGYNALDVEDSLQKMLYQKILSNNLLYLFQTQTLPPQAFTAQDISMNSITLSWQPQMLDPLPEPVKKGDPPVGGGYVITVEGLEPIVLEDVTQTSYQLTGLQPYTTYKIQIQAFTNAHKDNPNQITSVPSPVLEVTTQP